MGEYADLELWRFIPAGAGNRRGRPGRPARTPVHPRGCGEQPASACAAPRCRGSSPRVRGTGLVNQSLAFKLRFIPAGAGNRLGTTGPHAEGAVHPRGCGEQRAGRVHRGANTGSSPRVRGTDAVEHVPVGGRRFIPAGAGNSRCQCRASITFSVHPRGCGEQRNPSARTPANIGSSPRVRGTGDLIVARLHLPRFIPAGAGNRPAPVWSSSARPVHPRGCGEQMALGGLLAGDFGSSPRVRGTDFLQTMDLPKLFDCQRAYRFPALSARRLRNGLWKETYQFQTVEIHGHPPIPPDG